MTANPNGCVWLGDNGIPRTWTGKAGADISGGQFLKIVSGASPVASGNSSYDTSDIILVTGASGADVIGIATQNVSSGTNAYATFATKGLFLATVRTAVDPTDNVCVTVDGSDSLLPTTTATQIIGRAWSNSASGTAACAVLSLDI